MRLTAPLFAVQYDPARAAELPVGASRPALGNPFVGFGALCTDVEVQSHW